jgi:hypothetical protein
MAKKQAQINKVFKIFFDILFSFFYFFLSQLRDGKVWGSRRWLVRRVCQKSSLQGVTAKAIAQGFQGQDVFRRDVSQADVRAEAEDEELLLVFDGRLPL